MLSENALHSLQALFPRKQLFTDRTALITYEVDAGLDKGLPEGVAFPRSVDEVVKLARWASDHHVALIARGAGTGLSGGAVADQGGIIVEFAHMNRILQFDAEGRNAIVQPALINLRLDEQARKHGLYFPPDPSSQRASTIGGNVAENSGGPHCFKYGVMTNYVKGMEVVLANGHTVQLGGHALDYPEYDLCSLVTGSEGTLGLITSVTVRLQRNPPGVQTLLAVFDSVEQAGNAVSAVIAAGLVPATMEMMEQKIVHIIEPFAQAGLPLDAGAVLIIEVDGYLESLDAQIEEIVTILHQHEGHDMRVARNAEERARIWLARKSAAGAVSRVALAHYTVDITVPRSRLAEVLTEVNQICDEYQLQVGHLLHAGDGNLHPMILIPDPNDSEYIHRVHLAGRAMVACSVKVGGSLTGEHGVGIEKRSFMPIMHQPAELLAMWDIKQTFDPTCMLNPGKIFPPPAQGEQGPYAGYLPQSNNRPAMHSPTGAIFAPTTAREAAEGLAALSQGQRPVAIGSAQIQHNSQVQPVQLDTRQLQGISMYASDDLYLTAGAGTTLAEIEEFLKQEKQHLAITSPWPTTTIGGLVATNLNAPLRMRYGGLRDLVLCATVALADGRVIRTGRPIVKNVAGYDLTRVFVGSYGTLGLLTDISLKLSPRPRVQRTLLCAVDDPQQGLLWGQQLLTLALNASAIVLCQGFQPEHNSPFLLAYTAEGLSQDVAAELEQVQTVLRTAGAPEPQEVETLTGTTIWSAFLAQQPTDHLLVRAGLPGNALKSYMQTQAHLFTQQPWLLDIASGQLYLSASSRKSPTWLTTIRESALACGGYAIGLSDLDRSDDEQLFDRWGYQPSGLEVMQRLKKRWDPSGILNPGVFVVDRSQP